MVAAWWPLCTVAQQSDTGQIRIVVTDASSKTPVELARVLLSGPVITSELTGRNGQVLFTDVPDGIYRARVLKGGYEAVTSEQFEIIEGNAVEVNVSLAQFSGLKVIGHITVHSSTVISADTINANSPQSLLSSDLAGALSKLSGVSISTSSDDSDATETISLEGQDASQTQLTLDGIPLNAPGTAGNLRGFATDLFTGASVHFGPQAGALAGGVNFTTLEPTLSWLSYGSLALGSYGRYNYSAAETGSDGKLGVAVEVVDRNTPSLVDGDYYLDSSGLAYVHNGDNSTGGELVKLHYDLSDTQTLIGTFLGSTVDTNIVCLRYNYADMPCGYGPNNGMQSNFDLYSLTDDALVGDTTIQASLYGMDSKGLNDELNRYVDGIPSPSGSGTASGTNGFIINATLPSRQRHTIAIEAYDTVTHETITPLVPQSIPYYSGAAQSSYGALQLTDTIHSNDKLTLSEGFGVSRTSNAPASALGSTAVTWRPDTLDTYSVQYALGGSSAGGLRQTELTDPASLRFDCYGNVAYGSAPGAQPGASNSSSVRVNYTHTLFGGNIALALYREVEDNVVLPVDVNGSVLAANGVLPPDYASLVEQIWDSPAGCNAAAGTAVSPSQLYFSTAIAGTQRVYQGAELTSYLTFGGLIVEPYYNITGAVIYSGSPLVNNPYSFVIPGQQVAGTPLHKAGVTFLYKAQHSAVMYLWDAQYTSINNGNNLPSYLTFDGGLGAQLAHGTLTVVAQNITDSYGGVFTSPEWEVPYTTIGGYVIKNLARPLTPREYQVTYTVRFGQGVRLLQSATPPPNYGHRGGGGPGGGGAMFFGPGEGPPEAAGGGQGRGGFRQLLEPLPSTPPAQPFAVTNDPQTCSASNAGYAQQLSTELTAFAARIEAAKTPAGYPATIAPPLLPDATITYHDFGSTYALTITPKPGHPVRGIIGCMTIHIARAADVTSRHLYAPQSVGFFMPQLDFMPAVGLYLALRQQQEGQESFRVYVLPSTPPKAPFEVRSGGGCTGDLYNTAVQMLGELRSYFTGGASAASWTITQHAARAGTWYELDPGDPSTIGALLMCGRVSTATEQELTQRGYDGKSIPELNYSPALGIYMVRPEFRRTGPGVSPAPSPLPSPP